MILFAKLCTSDVLFKLQPNTVVCDADDLKLSLLLFLLLLLLLLEIFLKSTACAILVMPK